MSQNYAVLSPIGKKTTDAAPAVSRFSDLNGKTVCELDGRCFRANEALPLIRELLRQRYPAVKFIKAGEIHAPDLEDQAVKKREKSLADLSAALVRRGSDAVITGNGG